MRCLGQVSGSVKEPVTRIQTIITNTLTRYTLTTPGGLSKQCIIMGFIIIESPLYL